MIPATDTVRRPRGLEGGRRVYVSGPMRGYPQHNFPAFDAAEELLRSRLGVEVVNPARIDREEYGYDGSYALSQRQIDALLERDLAEVENADAVILLAGWRYSVGANLERDRAIACGIPRWELVGNRFLIPDRGSYRIPRLPVPVDPPEEI